MSSRLSVSGYTTSEPDIIVFLSSIHTLHESEISVNADARDLESNKLRETGVN